MSVPMEENKENEVTTEELKECGEKLIEGLKKLMEVEILGFQKAKVEEFEVSFEQLGGLVWHDTYLSSVSVRWETKERGD